MAHSPAGGFGRLFAVSSFLLVCAPAVAEPLATIRTPPPSAIASISNEETLQQLVLANLIASNCEIAELQAGDAALLAGTAQAMAEQMKIGTEQYFSDYIHPAMAALATPDSCNHYAGPTQDMVKQLKELGGAVLNE